MAKGYNFGSSAKHSGPVRHMKEIKRGGISVASGSFPAGSSVRIQNRRPGRAGR